jgi:hypothetical protein
MRGYNLLGGAEHENGAQIWWQAFDIAGVGFSTLKQGGLVMPDCLEEYVALIGLWHLVLMWVGLVTFENMDQKQTDSIVINNLH